MRGCRRVRGREIVLGLVPIVCLVALSTTGGSNRLTPLAPTVVLPQQAVGDFDGDGQVDVARIQHGVRGTSITVHLSDAAEPTQLDADVSALVERDIDRDGDLDLVATTRTGAVLIWINDGHGNFSQREPSGPSHLAGDAGLVQAGPALSAAVTVQILTLPPARSRRRSKMVVTRIRPPTVGSASSQELGLLPPFRAPPALDS